MNNQTLTLSKIFVTLTIALTVSNFVQAQAQVVRQEGGGLYFTQSGQMGPIKVTVTAHEVRANAPISQVCVKVLPTGYGLASDGITFQPNGRSSTVTASLTRGQSNQPKMYNLPTRDIRQIKFTNLPGVDNAAYFEFCGVEIRGGSLNLPEDMKVASMSMMVSYQSALDQIEEFNLGIKNSDKRHLARLRGALTNTMKLMSDEKGLPVLPVTSEIVRENSRLIMVLATVINELLVDYADVGYLKVPIEILKNLATQIRDAYGWNEGLAGASSKSLAALGVVVDLELRDLYSTLAAAGVTEVSTMNAMIRATHHLIAKVNAANGGDSASQEAMANFRQLWNSADIQSLLNKLMSASPDVSGLIQPKLKLLFTAIEAMSNLTESDLSIPTGNKGEVRPRTTGTSGGQTAAVPPNQP